MHVRCPHCHNPIELISEASLEEILCPTCGSRFSLLSNDTTESYYAKTKRVAQFELIEQVGIGHFGSV